MKVSSSYYVLTLLLCCLALSACTQSLPQQNTETLLIYGVSGRIGGHIVDEALRRGYTVTGVSRDPSAVAPKPGMVVVKGDILDQDNLRELLSQHRVVLVSVGGRPRTKDPKQYIAGRAAHSLIQALSTMGDQGPRVLFVGNVFTLEVEAGKTYLDLGRVTEEHRNYAMFYSHQEALDAFRESRINWTVVSPPNGLRLQGRTGQLRYATDSLIRNSDGTPATISPEDFAYAMLEEVTNEKYLKRRFTVARLSNPESDPAN